MALLWTQGSNTLIWRGWLLYYDCRGSDRDGITRVCVHVQCLLLHLPSSPKEGKTWRDAESICSSFESSLVTIDSEIEQGGENLIRSRQFNCKYHLQTSSIFKNVCVCVFHAVVSAAFITMLLQGSAVGVWISLKWTGYRNWSPVESDLTVSSSELKNNNSTCCILGYTTSSKDCLQTVIDKSGGLKLEQAVSVTLLL